MMKNSENLTKLKLAVSMIIFGTIGLVVRNISLPSAFIALSRGAIGSIVLLVFFILKRKKLNVNSIKSNFIPLFISGFVLGLNWILLFEAYKYTTVATATLCYYMAPVFVLILSPFLLREKIEFKRILCVLISLVGMVMVSGVNFLNEFSVFQLKGVFLGIGAAAFYCCIIIANKKIKDLPSEDMTFVQLSVSAVTMLIYVLITEDVSSIKIEMVDIFWLLLAGVLHTGVAYLLYFSSVNKLKAQTSAVFSYIDPLIAVAISIFVLKEGMTASSVIGSILILGSTLVSELVGVKKKS